MRPMGSKAEQLMNDALGQRLAQERQQVIEEITRGATDPDVVRITTETMPVESGGYVAVPEDRYAVSCVGCGKIEHLVMLPLRHEDGAVTGWAFACPDCREHIQGQSFWLGSEVVCPLCKERAIRTHYQNEEGDWFVCWLCGCEPDPEKIAEAERVVSDG